MLSVAQAELTQVPCSLKEQATVCVLQTIGSACHSLVESGWATQLPGVTSPSGLCGSPLSYAGVGGAATGYTKILSIS